MGRISLRSPEYSPISSLRNEVCASSSVRHCLAATVLVTNTSVRVDTAAMAAMATAVFPAPQGKTTTPLPDATNASAAWTW